jgi:hypothetical protein
MLSIGARNTLSANDHQSTTTRLLGRLGTGSSEKENGTVILNKLVLLSTNGIHAPS